MINLKNALWTTENSAYVELALMVAVFGLDEVLHSLAEIANEQCATKAGENRTIVVEGKEYTLP